MNNQDINKGNSIMYASVSENPAGVLPNNAVFKARINPATNPPRLPAIFLPKKNAGIIARAISSTGIKNAALSRENFPLKKLIIL